MREESVRADGCAISNSHEQHELNDVGWLHMRRIINCVESEDVQIYESNDIAPFQNDLVFGVHFDSIHIRFCIIVNGTCYAKYILILM